MPATRRRPWTATEVFSPRAVTGGGVVAGVSCLYFLLTDTAFVGGAVPELLLELLLVGVPALGLVYTGYWLSAEGFDEDEVRDVGMTAVGGVLLATGLTGVLLASVGPDSITTNDTVFLLIGTGSEGALVGVLLGVLGATDLFREPEQDTVAHLETVNSVLRHNLRNRVAIMRGHLDFLTDEDDPENAHLETIQSQHEAILKLLDDVKLTSEAAHRSDLDAVDLAAVVEEQASLLESCHEAASVSIQVPAETQVRADDLLAPMLENLLFNAVAHSDRARTDIEVRATAEGDRVCLSVADDGPGIPDDRKERVRSPEVGDGTGMGLYLVDTVVSRYGGDLRIEDNHPRGTRIEVSLQRARP